MKCIIVGFTLDQCDKRIAVLLFVTFIVGCGDNISHHIENDSVEGVQNHLNSGWEMSPIKGEPPLNIAARSNSLKVAKLLINNGANPNNSTKWGITALHVASRYSDTLFIQYLIDNAAAIDVANHNGYTPLWLAVQYGKYDNVKTLLDNGADPNFPAAGVTAIFLAVQLNNEQIVRLLVERGADVNLQTLDGRSLVDFCSNDIVGIGIRQYILDAISDDAEK